MEWDRKTMRHVQNPLLHCIKAQHRATLREGAACTALASWQCPGMPTSSCVLFWKRRVTHALVTSGLNYCNMPLRGTTELSWGDPLVVRNGPSQSLSYGTPCHSRPSPSSINNPILTLCENRNVSVGFSILVVIPVFLVCYGICFKYFQCFTYFIVVQETLRVHTKVEKKTIY